jgi:hypothetical protein
LRCLGDTWAWLVWVRSSSTISTLLFNTCYHELFYFDTPARTISEAASCFHAWLCGSERPGVPAWMRVGIMVSELAILAATVLEVWGSVTYLVAHGFGVVIAMPNVNACLITHYFYR